MTKGDTRSMLELEVQYAVDSSGVPGKEDFVSWARAALSDIDQGVEMVVRIVDEPESRDLNSRYRGKDKPTNVLSFPFEAPPEIDSSHLGDLVICAPVVRREAREQCKQELDHWAHMVVHGILHLRGFDHETDEEAQAMEALEKQILSGLGIQDPYRITDVAV
ncbi:rRNA maturation RNase YbeY [Thiogranum longum]